MAVRPPVVPLEAHIVVPQGVLERAVAADGIVAGYERAQRESNTHFFLRQQVVFVVRYGLKPLRRKAGEIFSKHEALRRWEVDDEREVMLLKHGAAALALI